LALAATQGYLLALIAAAVCLEAYFVLRLVIELRTERVYQELVNELRRIQAPRSGLR
jgi:hypothetical protein